MDTLSDPCWMLTQPNFRGVEESTQIRCERSSPGATAKQTSCCLIFLLNGPGGCLPLIMCFRDYSWFREPCECKMPLLIITQRAITSNFLCKLINFEMFSANVLLFLRAFSQFHRPAFRVKPPNLLHVLLL